MRYSITFTGRVQGMGFRYTAQSMAQRYRVTGWVRNDADGSVGCVVEGQQDELDRFVGDLQRAMDGYIAETRIQTAPATGEFQGFNVRH
jgi:acylphosphatase